MAADGHSPLIALLSHPLDTPRVQLEAAIALYALSNNPVNLQPLVDQLNQLFRGQQPTSFAKECAAKVFCNLSKNFDNRQPLVEAGVHILLSKLLIDPQATNEAKEKAAKALYNLSVDPANLTNLMAIHSPLITLCNDRQATDNARKLANLTLRNLTNPINITTSLGNSVIKSNSFIFRNLASLRDPKGGAL